MRTQKNQNAASFQEPKIKQVKQPGKKCTCSAGDPPKPKLPAGMRRLQVQQKFVSHVRSYKPVPVIMLTGEWLRNLGFEYQKNIILVENEGRLIISLDTV